MAGFRYGAIRAQNVGTFHQKKKPGPDQFWKMLKVNGKMGQKADGNRRRRAKKSLSWLGTAVTCMRRDWEKYLGVFLIDGKLSIWASVKMRECYSEVELEDEGWVSIAQDTIQVQTS